DTIEEIKQDLQKRLGKSPQLIIETFENWGRSQSSNVIACYPTTKADIQNLIKAAAAEGVKIRCAGSKHSWAPVFSDDKNLLLYVEKMQSDYKDGSRIRISNKKKKEVDVMTGVTTGDFKEFQIKNKLHLAANVILDVVQMVSVVATGCHGVGWDTKSPSDLVVKMRIFDSTGELRTYTKDDDPEMFKAVAANFGCFGVIFDMTIVLEPEIIVKTENRYFDLPDLFYNVENMKKLVEENWSVEIFWFPYNSLSLFDYEPKDDDIWVRIINKEKKSVKTETSTYYFWKDTKDSLTQEALAVVGPMIAGDPSLTPYYAWSAFKGLKHVIYKEGELYQELPHAVHFRKYIDTAPVNDMEYAFDLHGDYNLLLKIIQVVVSKVDHYEEKDEYPLNIALEMRFMGYSDVHLCPGNIGNPATGGSGHVFYIEVLSVAGTKGWEKFCTVIGKEWSAMGGIPHLAKQWDFLPNIEDEINSKMGNSINAFKEQLARSGADPNGMFMNNGMRKLLKL
ncbi:hypothetical protein FSP39_013180, partial [Pinctada imbricata]